MLQYFQLARCETGVALALQRTASRNLRIEYGLALGHFLDRADEVQVHRVLQDVAPRARFQRLLHQRVFRVHAQHQDGGFRQLRQDAPRSFNAVHLRQRTIHHDDIGTQLQRQLHRFQAIARFAGDLKRWLVLQHAAKSAAHQRVVVHQQNSQFIRHAFPPFPAECGSAPACLRPQSA